MDFLRLNRWKLIWLLVLSVVAASVYGGFLWLVGRKHGDFDAEAMSIIRWLIVGMSLFLFVGLFCVGILRFYRSRNMLAYRLPAAMFDNDVYQTEYLNKNSRIFFTRECLYGMINGYPVVVHIEPSTKRGETGVLFCFSVLISKFKSTRAERLAIPIKWDVVPADMRDTVVAFVAQIKEKGYPVGMVADGAAAASMIG